MEKIVFLLVCFGIFINAGLALQCYNCTSEDSQGCTRDASGNKPIICGTGLSHPQILEFCLRKTVLDKHLQKTLYISTCESFRKPSGREFNKNIPIPESIIVLDRNIQQCQSNAIHDVIQCDPCKDNLCNYFPNSAPKLNFFSLLCLPVWYFIVKFI